MDKPVVEIEYEASEGEWASRLTVPLIRLVTPKGAMWKTYRIGRSPDCEIHIPWLGSLLGRYQATLLRGATDPDYFICNGTPTKKPTNAIRVNNQVVEYKSPLTHGDVVRLAFGLRLRYFNREAIADNLSEVTLTDLPDL